METNNNKYSKLKGTIPMIASSCGCSKDYVRRVFSGNRVPKTERAELANKILKFADELLEIYNKHNN